MVNAHCHSFQRLLRGRTEGRDFWAWRDTMLALAAHVSVRETYEWIYGEIRDAGYTAVGEFHYLGLDDAHAAAAAKPTFSVPARSRIVGGIESRAAAQSAEDESRGWYT